MDIWRGDMPLVLASQSQSRQTLLRNAGIAFDAVPAHLDERTLQTNAGLTDPGAVAGMLAAAKAQHVARDYPGCFVLGADQTLALGTTLINKPETRAQAAEQLRQLAGHTHALHAAVALVCDGRVIFEHVSVAQMTMRPLSTAAIDAYLDAAGDSVVTTVGAYQLEKLGVHLFERIEGDHFTILGLPLLALLDFLRRQGLLSI
jgi:septum formation protein